MLKSHEIADRLDELERRALALFCAIQGLEVLNKSLRSCVSDLAWDLSEGLRKLSDQVHPAGSAKIKAVAS